MESYHFRMHEHIFLHIFQENWIKFEIFFTFTKGKGFERRIFFQDFFNQCQINEKIQKSRCIKPKFRIVFAFMSL